MRYCEENNVTFRLNGEFIRELRRNKGLSQTELAADLCMEQYQISKIENNKSIQPRYSTLCMMADYFGVCIDNLIVKEHE